MFADKIRGAGLLTLLTVILVRWCTSVHSYSGQGKPPMYGDYEAQRHWMEITYNLPVEEWYFNTSSNDLMYWGLDYPPLTAYHSKLCGYIASFLNEDFVKLGSSRGYESYSHKLFMRCTVIFADLVILLPAVWFYFSTFLQECMKIKNRTSKQNLDLQSVWTFLCLMYPGLILIDHGHFQYNGVSLGLTIGAITALCSGKEFYGSVLFVLAINYKQMSLYHALPFFCYLLGKSLKRGFVKGSCHVLALGIVVIGTFLVVWSPFLRNTEQIVQLLHRLFPVARGVFEDKVANIWCSINLLIKLKSLFTNDQMLRICLGTTILAIIPSSIDILLRPKLSKFVPALINSALAFFLFSFQVHEKSILLAAVPVALYFPLDPFIVTWFLTISTFSMLPLLLKDGLLVPTIALTLFHIVAVTLMVEFLPVYGTIKTKNESRVWDRVVKLLFILSMIGCALLALSIVLLSPPNRFPDLYPVLISVYSCAHFLIFFFCFNYIQIVNSDLINNVVVSKKVK